MRLELIEYGFELLPDHGRTARFDAVDSNRILSGNTSDHTRTVNTQGRERFQIRLNTRATAAVGAGNGQRDGYGLPFRHDRIVMAIPKTRNVNASTSLVYGVPASAGHAHKLDLAYNSY